MKVTVHVQDVTVVPGPVLNQALGIAANIFAGAAVRIDWRIGTPLHGKRSIAVSMAAHTPDDYLPGAMASARVYEGVHVTVFWDRVEYPVRGAPVAVILAHVLAHEITHILQGIDRHSESGVMKAHWTKQDFAEMALKPLPFGDL